MFTIILYFWDRISMVVISMKLLMMDMLLLLRGGIWLCCWLLLISFFKVLYIMVNFYRFNILAGLLSINLPCFLKILIIAYIPKKNEQREISIFLSRWGKVRVTSFSKCTCWPISTQRALLSSRINKKNRWIAWS